MSPSVKQLGGRVFGFWSLVFVGVPRPKTKGQRPKIALFELFFELLKLFLELSDFSSESVDFLFETFDLL